MKIQIFINSGYKMSLSTLTSTHLELRFHICTRIFAWRGTLTLKSDKINANDSN